MRTRGLVIAAVGLAMAGCGKKDATPTPTPTPTPSTTASTAAGADAGSGTGTGTGTGTRESYGGKYAVVLGKMYVPDQKDWSSVKWKNDETKPVGEGAIAIAIEPSGRVSGTTEGGPLGSAILEGTREGESLMATIRRKDPADEGLTGTLVANVKGDAIEGTMKLSDLNAASVREAKVDAKKK